MAVVCLASNQPTISMVVQLLRTWRRPFNSRSPRSLTITISSIQRRTRSSGSLLVSSRSSMLGGRGLFATESCVECCPASHSRVELFGAALVLGSLAPWQMRDSAS